MKNSWTISIAASLLFCFCQPLLAQSNTSPSLFPGRCYPVGDTPNSLGESDLLSTDMDGDSFIDLISIDADLDLLTVWTNNGSRIFQPALSIDIPDNSRLGGIGNFNGDGIPDFVLLAEFASGLEDIFWIVSSLSDSEFVVSEPMDIPLMSSSTIDVADFNNDGLDDLLSAGNFRDAVVLINQGANQFSLQAEFDVNLVFATGPVVCDIDSDLDVDVVLPTNFGVELFLNDGDANFTSNGIAAEVSGSVVLGDMNSDNRPDLAVATSLGEFTVFLNNQNLEFAQSNLVDVDITTVFIELADINGDQDLDIVFGSGNNTGVGRGTFVFDNDGSANFNDTRVLLNNFPNFFAEYGFADIDNDGDDDILFYDNIFRRMCVTETENGAARDIHVLQYSEQDVLPDSAGLVDVDGDNDLDLILVDPSVSVFFNDGNGSFSLPQFTYLGTGFVEAVFDDIDNDSDIDMAILNRTLQQLSILLNVGDGTFVQGQMIDLSDYEPKAIAMADLNADSNLDVAVVANNPNADEGLLLVALNQGNGEFATQPTKFVTGVATNDLAIADFDGDSTLDVAVVDVIENSITILFNSGDANFPNSNSFSTGGIPPTIAAADLDGDADQDIVAVINSGAEITVFWNDGQANFPLSSTRNVVNSGGNLSIADFDCDGRQDLLVGSMSLLRNLGDMEFAPLEQYFAELNSNLVVGDIDGDDYIDVVGATGSYVLTSLNQISVAGDVNRDGKVTLLDVSPFVDVIVAGTLQKEADANSDGIVDLLDVFEFVELLTGG